MSVFQSELLYSKWQQNSFFPNKTEKTAYPERRMRFLYNQWEICDQNALRAMSLFVVCVAFQAIWHFSFGLLWHMIAYFILVIALHNYSTTWNISLNVTTTKPFEIKKNGSAFLRCTIWKKIWLKMDDSVQNEFYWSVWMRRKLHMQQKADDTLLQ